jgi:hypothetical protein
MFLMNIHFLRNSEIDRSAWDKCIAGSFNSSLCVFSWFLDLLCENWDALIEGDYESVMPLPTKHVFGKEIIYLPYFTQEFGIFSNIPINPDKTRAFLEAIPQHFSYFRIMLNKYNPVNIRDFNFAVRTRYELDLIEPYYRLAADITPDLQTKLNLAMANGFSYSAGLSPGNLINFIQGKRIRLPRALYRDDFRLLRSVIAGLISHKSGELFGVYDRHNELSSVSLFAWTNARINLIFQVVSPDRIQDYPHLFLIDRIIDKYSETRTTLLFESVDLPFPSVLYRDFGARETTCLEIFRNRLPFPLNLLIHYRIFNTCFSSSHASWS